MPEAIIYLYWNAFFGYCRLENESDTTIAVISTTRGFATDGGIHRINLVDNTCMDCDECLIDE